MPKWVVTRTLRYEIDNVSTASDAIEASKTAKNWNVIEVNATLIGIPPSARTNTVQTPVDMRPTGVGEAMAQSMNILRSRVYVTSQVKNYSDGRLKNEWFKLLRDIAGTTKPQSEWENYWYALMQELTARGLMDQNGHIISVSGVRTPRKKGR